MAWLFIKEGDWHLKIDTKEQLENYLEEAEKMFQTDQNHFAGLQKCKNGEQYTVQHSEYGFLARHLAEWTGSNALDAYSQIPALQKEAMEKVLNETGSLLINRSGGFHTGKNMSEAHPFVWKNSLTFPKYSKNDIRIKRFQDGKHYYAYIGDVQVRDGDTLKWNTEEEAIAAATSYIRKG